ncbi:MAG TPA: PKD domain-containing protein, partial [bacterium]|nr:PKD domain-containing protein [bacterium]
NGTPAEDPGGWLDPLYFLPEFHQKEASIQAVNVVAAPAAETAGTLSLTARAADWQVGVDIDEYYPNPENLSGLKVASGIAGVMLEVPGLGVFSEDPVSASGTGSGLDPITWTFSQSVAAAAEGRYPALVTAIDERYDPEAVASSADDHRAFQVTTVRIQPGGVNGQLPEAVLFSLPAPASAILRDAQFTFDGTYSYDPDGHPITRLDMDFDYDGSTFDVDFTASTPSGASVSHRYTAVGSYTCALRVQSSQGEWSDVATLPVVVSEDPVIPSPTVNWTRGVNVSPDDHFVRTDEASDSAIAVASDGTVHIAYVQEEEAIFLGTNYYVWYRKVSPSGVASPAEEVYHELRLDSVLPYSAIARTPTGTICIAYSLGSEIHYTAKGGGGWTTPVVIAAADDWGGEDLGRFDLAAAGNTKALAYDVEVAGTDLRKVLVVFQQGGVWQAEENAGVAYRAWGFTNPSLTAHDNGYVMAWEGGGLAGATNNDVFIRRWSSGSWGPKETVANTTADEGHPSVAVTGNTVAVGYLRSPSVFGRISFNGQPLGPEKALFQAAGTITYVEPVLVGGADGALACLALEKASGGQILGQPVLLAFDQSMELPIRDGLITRNLQVPSPGDPEYHHPDLAGDGVNRVACLVEINEPGFQRLRVIQGNFQMP